MNAWIDFNNEGVFNDTIYTTAGGERLLAARAIASGASATTQNITFTVPQASSPGTNRGVRVRLTNQATTPPTGAVGSGEIEDYVVTINCSALTVNPVTLGTPTVGASYLQTVTATGGLAPYTFAVSTGTLPAGLTLASDGAISGAPTSTTAKTFTIRATDSNGCQGTRSYTLTPVCPTVTVNPTSVANGALGIAYSQTLSGSGGTAPYSFVVSGGTLPAGLSLSSAGVLSGTPTSANGAGVNVTFRATDT